MLEIDAGAERFSLFMLIITLSEYQLNARQTFEFQEIPLFDKS